MKRCLSLLMILLILALFPVMALAESAGKTSFPYVLDNAGILTESQRSSLETRAAEFSEAHGCKLYIVTVKDHSEYNPDVDEAANGFYSQTRATLEGAMLRPRHDGYMAFQDKAAHLIAKGLLAKAPSGGIIEDINHVARETGLKWKP